MNLPMVHMGSIYAAIKTLRPHAKYNLINKEFRQWSEPNGLLPPTWPEIMAQVSKDKGLDVTSAQIQENEIEKTPLSISRMDVCKSCDFFRPSIFQCKKCKCFMPVKTLLPNARCPENKW